MRKPTFVRCAGVRAVIGSVSGRPFVRPCVDWVCCVERENVYVLIVSPDENVSGSLELVVTSLTTSDVAAAWDCARAHDLIAQRRPDLVLVDGRLPKRDVLNVVERLGRLAPPVRRMVLVAEAGAGEALAAAGAELLWLGYDPTARLLRTLTEVTQAAGVDGHRTLSA